MSLIDVLLGNTSEGRLKKLRPYVKRINDLESIVSALTDAELRAKTDEFKARLAAGETLDDLMCDAFAVVREAGKRVLNMRHFDVQLLGGMVLHQGRIAEMRTGEGKTLVATLPSYLNALEGKGVHVVTVNDYLARRDTQWMGRIHRFLGLSVGCILHDMDNDARREAYACDITYGTNNEFGFDYLRDNMVVYRENMVQRDLHYAIVDEVDSILIDEARTPLIISGAGQQSSTLYLDANRFVRSLRRGTDLVQVSKSDQLMGEVPPEDGDYQCDIKRRTVQLTAQGIAKAEKFFSVPSLSDPGCMELNHHILQALKAHSLFTRDKDYVVQDGQVIIVDEFTGRLMFGRRYSEGLHQALEAKEGVKIAEENKTLATITFQNYFRLFDKLAGMTGTAKTEESEFTGIYDLDVVEIPTNKPMIRKDLNDAVYTTEAGKFRAVVAEIEATHKTGQPVLVGTISVERSEYLSDLLRRKGIPHEVLNAKFHAKEAEIVAQAGKLNQVTIATNMAGRGTDIMLGGNPEFLARRALRQEGMEEWLIEEATGHGETSDEQILDARERYAEHYKVFKRQTDQEHAEVVRLGGLHIIGTERHESRRIDNQLRGRSGRQGDPGSTRFYVSLEDDLMRRFGADRISGMMGRLNPDDSVPIDSKLVTRQIESAQKRVEAANFDARRNVLRYDDVMNKQREIIYGQRRRVLMGEDLSESILDMMKALVEHTAGTYAEGDHITDTDSYSGELCGICSVSPRVWLFGKDEKPTLKEAVDKGFAFAQTAYHAREEIIRKAGLDMREVERIILLRNVDVLWMDHIDAMDQLKQGISLRAYAQNDPVAAYTSEGFDMFDAMVASIREQTIRALFRAMPVQREQVAKPIEQADPDGNAPSRRTERKIGRNDPCPCGSGKKYKNCCGRNKE